MITVKRLGYEIKWKLQTLYWLLFQKGRMYCPTHHRQLKNRYCKLCDLVYWRGCNLVIINPKYNNGI